MATKTLVGTSFAGYRVESLLGRGGMSVVYLAEHPRLKSKVALKLLAPALAEDDVSRERLVRESRLAASLSHPNVIPVYDTGEEDGVLFVSMRFVAGQDLRALIREGGPLSLADTASVISQAAAALDAAHARGLVHRDVKPANILLEQGSEGPWHVYVADFGLTKHTDPVKVEFQLMKLLPQEAWTRVSHQLILHGRRVCASRSPQCEACTLAIHCPKAGVAAAKKRKPNVP